MGIPERIKIGWKIYKVNVVEPQSTLYGNGDECYGQIDYDKQTIDLRNSNSTEQNEVTLIHEVLHGIGNMYSMDLTEEVVSKLADALYTVVKDNGLEIKSTNQTD